MKGIDELFAHRDTMLSEGLDIDSCAREQNLELGVFEYIAPEGKQFVVTGDFEVERIPFHPWVCEPNRQSVQRFLDVLDEEGFTEVCRISKEREVTTAEAAQGFVRENPLDAPEAPVDRFITNKIGFRLREGLEPTDEPFWELYAVGAKRSEEVGAMMPLLVPEKIESLEQELSHGKVNIVEYMYGANVKILGYFEIPPDDWEYRDHIFGALNTCDITLENKGF